METARIKHYLSSQRQRLVLWMPGPLMAGIWAYFTLEAEPPVWGGPLALALCALLVGLLWHRAARPFAVALLLVALGFTAAQVRAHYVQTPMLSEGIRSEIEGTIEDIDPIEGKVRLVLERPVVEGLVPELTPRRLRVNVYDHGEAWQAGDRVRVYASLYPLPPPDLPGAYDFARHFYFRSIGGIGFAMGTPEVIASDEPGFSEWLNGVRHQIGDDMRARLPGAVGTVAAAMTVGETGPIPEEVKEELRNSGLAHMLSISGLHLSIVTGIIFFFVRLLLTLWPAFALRMPTKKIAACFALAGASIYLMLAGAPVPAQRAFIMVAVLFTAVLLDRRAVTLRTLSLAAAVILLLFPEAMFGASFQLSFAATMAIVSLYEKGRGRSNAPMSGLWRWWHVGTHHLWDIALTSLAATAATAPFILYNFNRFAVFSLIANMIVIPLATFVIMPGMVLGLLLIPIGWQGIGYTPMGYGTDWMILMADWVTALPYSSIRLPSPTDAGVALGAFGLMWLCLMTRRRWIGALLIAGGLSTIVLHVPYDLLVSNDGKKVAWRMHDGNFLFVRGRSASFDGQAWLRFHAQEEGLTLRDLEEEEKPDCNQVFCLIETHGMRIAIGRRAGRTEGICESQPDMVISDNDLSCPGVKQVIDGAFLRAHGAVALRFGPGGVTLEEAGNGHGKRLWNMAAHPAITGAESPGDTP